MVREAPDGCGDIGSVGNAGNVVETQAGPGEPHGVVGSGDDGQGLRSSGELDFASGQVSGAVGSHSKQFVGTGFGHPQCSIAPTATLDGSASALPIK